MKAADFLTQQVCSMMWLQCGFKRIYQPRKSEAAAERSNPNTDESLASLNGQVMKAVESVTQLLWAIWCYYKPVTFINNLFITNKANQSCPKHALDSNMSSYCFYSENDVTNKVRETVPHVSLLH